MKHRIIILLFGILVVAGAAARAHPIDKLKPGEWMEVPDSKLKSVGFKWPKGIFYTQNGIGIPAVISTWSGGAYDTKRDRLLIWGGGHFAYGGNEIYGFDINTLKWSIVGPPSMKVEKGYPNGSEKYSDNTPRACHTYNYIQYVPSIDRFMSFGTVANFPASKGGKTVWAYDFEKKKWEEKGETLAGGIGAYSALDPVTGLVFVRGTSWGICLATWNPATGEWKNLTGRVNHRTDYYKTATIDPVGRIFIGVGKKLVYKYEFGKEGKITQDKITTEGPQDIVNGNCPGLQYDPVLDRIVGWFGGADFYLLDTETWKWEKRAASDSNKVTPTPPCKTGTYGRFRYIPSKNAYVVVNDAKQNVFIGRVADRAAEPIPERFKKVLNTSKESNLVKYAAKQTALWPKDKAEPVLKEALKAQKQSGNREAVNILEETLKTIEEKK